MLRTVSDSEQKLCKFLFKRIQFPKFGFLGIRYWELNGVAERL